MFSITRLAFPITRLELDKILTQLGNDHLYVIFDTLHSAFNEYLHIEKKTGWSKNKFRKPISSTA